MNQYPRVSVIISTYDRPQRLDAALASVHAQTFSDFEVIVVDDCSPNMEAVRGVLEKWYTKFEERGIELIGMRLGENSGYQCMPKNRGIEQARGDYIAYLDDDNTWRPEHLAVLVEAIESDFSADMVYSRQSYRYESPELRDKLKEKFGRDPYPDGDGAGMPWNPQMLSQMNYVDTSVMLHSKGAFWRLVRDSGYGWDETLRRFGDWNFVWRWAVYGLTAKLVDKVTMDYLIHAGSMQIVRPAIEVPVCLNYVQYQALRKDRNQELLAASSPAQAANTISSAP
jgi:glycosyltransferase involved in cell wall biosynthesis